MRPLDEFEIHVVCPDDWNPPEAWLVIIHKTCGAKIGDDLDMVDLETAVDKAVDHVCDAK